MVALHCANWVKLKLCFPKTPFSSDAGLSLLTREICEQDLEARKEELFLHSEPLCRRRGRSHTLSWSLTRLPGVRMVAGLTAPPAPRAPFSGISVRVGSSLVKSTSFFCRALASLTPEAVRDRHEFWFVLFSPMSHPSLIPSCLLSTKCRSSGLPQMV